MDHETTREYLLTIVATDRGDPPLSNSAIVSINVSDVNDNAPQFSQETYSVHIPEDVRVGSEVSGHKHLTDFQ